MRTLNRNKKRLYYANLLESEPIYEKNPDGTDKTIVVDGVATKVISGYTSNMYDDPVIFWGSLSLSGGEVENVEYGIDDSAYDAVLIVNKTDNLPISETSLIWSVSEPRYINIQDETFTDPYSADYRVVRVSPSLNESKYLLTRIVKG